MVDRDAALGGLLGVHVGDALGATTEFAKRSLARQLLPDRVVDTEIVGGGMFAWPAGAATDDTDLTLAITRAYLETSARSTAQVVTRAAEHMLAWKRRGPRDIGGATIERAIDMHIDNIDGVNGPSQGWVLTSLALAVAALQDERPAAEVLLHVVRLGGDADTNGAICGGLLGVRDGISAWPQRWLDQLEHHDELRAAAPQLARLGTNAG